MDIPGPTVRVDAGMRGGTGSALARLRPRPPVGRLAPQRFTRRSASQPPTAGCAGRHRPTGGRAAVRFPSGQGVGA
jgi:hypothetical protein